MTVETLEMEFEESHRREFSWLSGEHTHDEDKTRKPISIDNKEEYSAEFISSLLYFLCTNGKGKLEIILKKILHHDS